VKGELQDPFASGKWLKANSATVLESTKVNISTRNGGDAT